MFVAIDVQGTHRFLFFLLFFSHWYSFSVVVVLADVTGSNDFFNWLILFVPASVNKTSVQQQQKRLSLDGSQGQRFLE
jgi:hypothetical protein